MLSPIFLLLEDLYGASLLVVNLLSNCYMAFYLPMNFPTVWFVEKYGLKWGTFLGIAIMTVGIWIRCFVNTNFYTVMVGQFMMAAISPIICNTPALVTTNWFPQKERSLATMIALIANSVGIMIGYLLPALFIDEYDDDSVLTDKNRPIYRQQVFNMLISMAVFSTVIMVLVLFTFRDKPGVPLFAITP